MPTASISTADAPGSGVGTGRAAAVADKAEFTAAGRRTLTRGAPGAWQAQLVAADTPTKIRLLAIDRVQAEVKMLLDASRYETERERTSLEHVYYVLGDVRERVKAETGYSELSSDLDLLAKIGEFFTRSPKHKKFGFLLIYLAGKWNTPDELMDLLRALLGGG